MGIYIRKILDRVFGLSFEEDIEDGNAGLDVMKFVDTGYMTSPFKESGKQLAVCVFEYAHNFHISL
ncbi:hypothetical protein FKX85_06610 [Echinicola soli]|uniref:Uncharacterized protein n=1 Tax=Echinicola soli TaxID=2591634 RepID=A0A514CGE1_9BACT|nr:hypothetical protein [Echinicola soli]QDH78724.1 hypothetical protein FKX85_06610 [Echinicola soli]